MHIRLKTFVQDLDETSIHASLQKYKQNGANNLKEVHIYYLSADISS